MFDYALEKRRREDEDKMVALYAHLLREFGSDEAEGGIMPAEACPHCGGRLIFHRQILSCTHCGARVAA